MTRTNLIRVLVGLAASLRICTADVVEAVTTFGPGNSVNYYGGYLIGDPTQTPWYNVQGNAARFTVAVGGPLERIEIPLYRSGRTATSTTPRPIALRADDGGKPGQVLESWTVPPSTILVKRLTSVARPTLVAGQSYWLDGEMKADGTAMDIWNLNSVGATGTLARQFALNGPWTVYTGVALPAFRVSVSTPAVEVVSTLGPSSSWSSYGALSIGDPVNPLGAVMVATVAMPFVPDGNYRLESVELPLRRSAGTATSTTPRRIVLAADAGGVPGATLESWSVVPGSTTALVRFPSTARPQLRAGSTYWLYPTINPTGTAVDLWFLTTLRITSQYLQQRGLDGAWYSVPSTPAAFRITGTTMTSVALSEQAEEAAAGEEESIVSPEVGTVPAVVFE